MVMDEEEIQHLQQLRAQYIRSLRLLQLQEAQFSIEVPIHIKMVFLTLKTKSNKLTTACDLQESSTLSLCLP
jgi:hypothetical protein